MAGKNPYELISSLTSNLPPEEVVWRFKQVNEYEARIGKREQLNAAYRLLEESGFNRNDDWVYLELGYPETPDQAGVEALIQSWRRIIPESVDIIAVQGGFLGGVTHDAETGVHSWIKPTYMQDNFSLFIRVKPAQLPDGN